ncbi:MAG: lipocalin family protein [Pseudomonadota bacterium]
MKPLYLLFLSCVLSACMGIPDGITVVDKVEPAKYLGTWYEIARLDHRFERGLEKVTATYSMRDDGGIQVINGGFNTKEQKWEQAVGKAYFIDEPHADGTYPGKLKVSFFGPFYGAYNIIELDKPDYNYVMVCGPDKSYFWILSRTPDLAEPIKQRLISKAGKLGFATDKLIYMQP